MVEKFRFSFCIILPLVIQNTLSAHVLNVMQIGLAVITNPFTNFILIKGRSITICFFSEICVTSIYLPVLEVIQIKPSFLQKEHKLKVFAGARVCFVGFPEDETQHMAEVLASNGGVTCPLDDPDCTHVVSTHPILYYTQHM